MNEKKEQVKEKIKRENKIKIQAYGDAEHAYIKGMWQSLDFISLNMIELKFSFGFLIKFWYYIIKRMQLHTYYLNIKLKFILKNYKIEQNFEKSKSYQKKEYSKFVIFVILHICYLSLIACYDILVFHKFMYEWLENFLNKYY